MLSTTVRVATSAGSAPAHVLTLAKGALIAMTWNKLKMVAALGLMAGLTVGGAGASGLRGGGGEAVARIEAPVQPDELTKLQGKWSLEAREPALGDARDRELVWTIEGKTLVATERGQSMASELVLGEAGTLDILLQIEKDGPRPTQRCLYRFEGDNTLVICGGDLGDPRPAGFKPGDSGHFPALYRFARQREGGKADAGKAEAQKDVVQIQAIRSEPARGPRDRQAPP